MSSELLRKEVFKSFKNLHRVSHSVFKNDESALKTVRKEINAGYKKNKNVQEPGSIKELIKFANDVAHEIKTTVAELKETRPGVFSLNLRPEMFDIKETSSK